MRLNLKQTKALDFLEDDITTEVEYGGGAGGGKSILGCYWQLKRRLKYPGTRGLIGRSILKTLKETTLNSFFEVCKMQGLKAGVHYKYNQQSNIINFPNSSLIFLKDLYQYPADPNFDELGSLEITDAFIDENNQITEKAWNIVKSRIRYKLDEYELIPKMLGSCNPAKNWIYNRFYKPFREKKLPDNIQFIQALVGDNTDISIHYRSNLLTLDKASKERLLYGNWEYDDDPTVLCDFDAINDAFTNEHVKPGKKTISADLAMQGRDRFIAGSWEGLICKVRIDKLKARGKEIELDVKTLMKDNRVGHSQTVVDSDGLGAYLESYLEGIVQFHGGARAANAIEFANLKSQCAYKLAEFINKREIKIICTDQQKTLIIEELGVLKSASVDADESRKRIIKKEEMKELLGRSPDYLDMLLMNMYFWLFDFDDWNIKRR